MNAVFKIAGHSYRRIVYTPGFIITVTLGPLLLIASLLVPFLVERTAPIRYISIIDQTGHYEQSIQEAFEYSYQYSVIWEWDNHVQTALIATPERIKDLPDYLQPGDITRARIKEFFDHGGPEYANRALKQLHPEIILDFSPTGQKQYFVPAPIEAAQKSFEELATDLRPWLLGERMVVGPKGEKPLFAAVFIAEENSGPVAQYWSDEITSLELSSRIERAIERNLQQQAWQQFGLDKEQVDAIKDISFTMDQYKPTLDPDEAEVSSADIIKRYLPAGLAYILFFSIFSGGGLLLTSVIEEKSNKIAEILLSSVTAQQLMFGKLLGQGLATLTMYAVWLLFSLGSMYLLAPVLFEMASEILLSNNLLPWFFILFILGYILFASIFMAIGSISPSIQDAQSYLTPLTLLLVLPIPLMIKIIQDPNGIIGTIMTFIPLYSPYALLIRVGAEPPAWELFGGMALLLATTLFMVWLMGRVFRASLLSAGEPPKLRNIFSLLNRSSS
ncbi:MAG: ABC transporter permease [bacterium]